MAARIIEQLIEIPAEHERNIFGQFDEHIKKIERTLQVTLISRDGILKIVMGCTKCAESGKDHPGIAGAFCQRKYHSESECGLCTVTDHGRERSSACGDG